MDALGRGQDARLGGVAHDQRIDTAIDITDGHARDLTGIFVDLGNFDAALTGNITLDEGASSYTGALKLTAANAITNAIKFGGFQVAYALMGWVLVSIAAALGSENAAFYWAILGVGVALLVLVLVGVIIYLALTIKAIALSQRQSNFIDSVTHELKSPLASLKLYLQTLTRRPVPPEQQADFHRFMLKDVERLDTLIDHLLDAAKTLQRRARPGTDATAITADIVVVCVGRTPRSAGLGLDGAGVVVDGRGFVEVDGRMRTAVPGVYAIGDLAPTPALAHVAFAEAIVAIKDIGGEEPEPIDYARIPWGIYCHPEVAFCGPTEEAARAAGHDVVTSVHRFAGNSRAQIMGEADGLVKVATWICPFSSMP